MNDTRSQNYADSLARLIRCETVSALGQTDLSKFDAFHRLLKEMFPALFQTVSVEEFDGSLLLCWKGRKREAEPLLLMSHHDVVEAPGDWTYPPFSGTVADGKLWGRGTLDTKGSLWAMLTAAEELAQGGFVPARDIYLESACTEETDGSGADRISKELQRRGLKFCMVLDEGGMMMYDPIGGAKGTFALIGVGEKGCADLKFTARSPGGHASTPGKNTPLVRLGKFMAAVEKSHIFQVQLNPVMQEMLERMAPFMSGPMGALFAHCGQLKPLLCQAIPAVSDTAGAMLKTTLAFTMCHGSDGRNVLPQEAYVIGNMRYSHHQGREKSFLAIEKLAKKFDVEMEVLDGGMESPLTDYQGEAFRLVEKAVSATFPNVTSVPYLMTGASDCRYFSRVCDNCLRFAPFLIDAQQLNSIHGIDENVDLNTLPGAVDFYKFIIREA